MKQVFHLRVQEKISNKWTLLLSPAFDVNDYLSPHIQIPCRGIIVSTYM